MQPIAVMLVKKTRFGQAYDWAGQAGLAMQRVVARHINCFAGPPACWRRQSRRAAVLFSVSQGSLSLAQDGIKDQAGSRFQQQILARIIMHPALATARLAQLGLMPVTHL